MSKAQKFRQFSTIFSFVVVLFFSIFKVWEYVTEVRVKGEQDPPHLERALIARVIDGDTVVLSDGRRLRYIGIDTPETVHPNKEVECFGQEASDYNKRLVEGKQVYLEADVQDLDRYGRLLRYVWLNDELINEKLVKEGYAFASAFPPNVKYQDRFNEAQRQAREFNLGLWSECEVNPTQEINQHIKTIDQKLMRSAVESVFDVMEENLLPN